MAGHSNQLYSATCLFPVLFEDDVGQGFNGGSGTALLRNISAATVRWRLHDVSEAQAVLPSFNPLNAGAAYIRVLIFYQHIKYYILNMLEINQQDLKRVDLHFVKSE